MSKSYNSPYRPSSKKFVCASGCGNEVISLTYMPEVLPEDWFWLSTNSNRHTVYCPNCETEYQAALNERD